MLSCYLKTTHLSGFMHINKKTTSYELSFCSSCQLTYVFISCKSNNYRPLFLYITLSDVLDPCTGSRAKLNDFPCYATSVMTGSFFPARWHGYVRRNSVVSFRLGNGDTILPMAIQCLTVGLLKLQPYLCTRIKHMCYQKCNTFFS